MFTLRRWQVRFLLVVTCVCVFVAVMLPASHASAQALCFESALNYAAGGGANSVIAADLDGDGDADLAVANFGSDNVSVLKNNGDGTFAAAVNYATGDGPNLVFAADLDGDNDADLMTPNIDGNVSVLRNNGDGTFAAAVSYAAGNRAASVFAADLDGDNDADLAVANYGSANVSVMKNNGDGTFVAAVNYPAGASPLSISAADLDGDNDADLAVANYNSDNVSVLKNNGDGTFEAAVDCAAGDGPSSVVAVDLDGDNDADLAVANYHSHDVSVLKNNGHGSFAAAVNYPAGSSPTSVFAADLDGDGDADLAVANFGSDNVSVLKNNGDGTLAAAINYAVGDGPWSVFAADLDGDNDVDLAVANDFSDNVSVLRNCLFPIIVSSLSNSGAGSLRSAIETANIHPSRDSIVFAVAGTIQPTSPLPYLSDATGGTVIDGLSAPGATPGHPTVILDGSQAGSGSGIEITSSLNVVRGLAITKFPGAGVALSNPAAEHNTISQNLIYDNGALGIGLASGSGLVAISVDTVLLAGSDSAYYVAGVASKKATVELFLAERYLGKDTVQDPTGHGEAWLYLGSDTADDVTGHWFIPAVNSRAWSYVTATATDALGSTSEFALNRRLVPDSLIYTAFCPVYMIVTSPNGQDSIGPGFNTLGSNATYDDTHDYGLGPDGIPGTLDDRVTITNIQPGEYTVKIIPDPDGSGNYFLGIRVDGTEANHWAKIDGFGDTTHTHYQSTPYSNPVPSPGEMAIVGFVPTAQRRGDLVGDGVYNLQDVVALVSFVFRGAAPPHPSLLADVNCDGFAANVQDVVTLVNHVFRNGAVPCP